MFANTLLIALIVVGILVGISMIPTKGIFKILTVMSGSMEPTIPTGSVIIVKPAKNYRTGDIITFRGPNISSNKKDDYTTHRIHDIVERDGTISYITKGDANESPDGEWISQDRVVGKEILAIALVGYLIGYIKTLPGLVLIIIIPATIIIYEEIRKISKETKKIIQIRKEKRAKAKGENKKSSKNNLKSRLKSRKEKTGEEEKR